MIWAKLDTSDGKRVTSEHHNRLLCSAPQIPDLDTIISRCCRDKVLIFVKVHREDLVRVGMDPFNITTLSQIPYSDCLVATAAAKNLFMCRVPDSSVGSEIVSEFDLLCHRSRIPNFHFHVDTCRQDRTLVQVTPFNVVNFTLVGHHNLKRALLCRSIDIPKFYRAIASSAQKLILIGLIKAYVKSSLRCLYFFHFCYAACIHIKNRDCACPDHSEVLTLSHSQLGPIERAPPARYVA